MAAHDEKSKKILELIGLRMRELRKKKGYSNYEQFAFEQGIGRAQYGKYEKGYDLYMSTFLRVLEGLDVSLEEFFSQGFENDGRGK